MIESIVGCKWSLHVLGQIRRGVNRPGALVRTAPGLTAKVLNERLSKMLRFGILDKRVYPQIPPRVEYVFTPFGRRFIEILDDIERLKAEAASGLLSRRAERQAGDEAAPVPLTPRVAAATKRTRRPPASPPRRARER